MTDNRYNGWTNYATWRVNLEMFDGVDFASDNDLDAYDLGQTLRDYANDLIYEQCDAGLALDYALAFLSDVNWTEIARAMIDNYRDSDGEA